MINFIHCLFWSQNYFTFLLTILQYFSLTDMSWTAGPKQWLCGSRCCGFTSGFYYYSSLSLTQNKHANCLSFLLSQRKLNKSKLNCDLQVENIANVNITHLEIRAATKACFPYWLIYHYFLSDCQGTTWHLKMFSFHIVTTTTTITRYNWTT